MGSMRTLVPSLLALLLVIACDSKSESKPSAESLDAKKAAEADADAKKIEERRKKREEEAAAKAKAEEERKQQIEALCVVPTDAKKPKKLDKACEDLAQAQMDFFARQYAEEPETLEKMKATAPLQKANIMKMCTTMDVAVGLKHAFDNAPLGFAPSTNDLIATCIQKLGDAGGGDAALPGKKPG
jgi:polynucleotide 5'-kinase involved in rRNA processing